MWLTIDFVDLLALLPLFTFFHKLSLLLIFWAQTFAHI
jgi:hypothetical protein